MLLSKLVVPVGLACMQRWAWQCCIQAHFVSLPTSNRSHCHNNLFPSRPQDCLALGSILGATDSVAALQVISQDRFPLLYSVVFGEGVLNDATSIVILGTIQAGGAGCWETFAGAEVAFLLNLGSF